MYHKNKECDSFSKSTDFEDTMIAVNRQKMIERIVFKDTSVFPFITLKKIVAYYHPKIACLVGQFNVLLAKLEFHDRKEIKLKQPDEFLLNLKWDYVKGTCFRPTDLVFKILAGGDTSCLAPNLSEHGLKLMHDYDMLC